jgi:hypothetical protein
MYRFYLFFRVKDFSVNVDLQERNIFREFNTPERGRLLFSHLQADTMDPQTHSTEVFILAENQVLSLGREICQEF